MIRFRWWLALPIAALIAGCLSAPFGSALPKPIETAFAQPDEVILYSLEPGLPGKDVVDGKTFHGHMILGQTEVKDAATRKKLFTAFRTGVADHDGSVAACFIPHHGLRVKTGKSIVDLVICFKCAQVKVYVNGTESEVVLVSTSPRAAFNDVLRTAKAPLSKDAE